MTLESSKLVKELTGTIINTINEYTQFTKSDRNDDFGEKFEECVRTLYDINKIKIVIESNFTEIINYFETGYSKY